MKRTRCSTATCLPLLLSYAAAVWPSGLLRFVPQEKQQKAWTAGHGHSKHNAHVMDTPLDAYNEKRISAGAGRG